MIDAVTGLYEDKYLERIAQNKAQANGGQAIQPSAPAPQAIPQAVQNPNVVVNTTSTGTTPQTHQVQSAGNTAPIADAQVVDMQPIEGQDLPFK